MSNTFLFTGEDSWSLTQELSKRKKAFIGKYTEQGLFEFKGEDIDLSILQNSILGGGMFTSKKLIIIHGIPKENNPVYKIPAALQNKGEERLIKNRATIPQDHVVILVCHKPDKRVKGRKFFEKNTQVKEFKPLSEKKLIQYVTQSFGESMQSTQAAYFVELVGTNLWNINHEIEKLKHYAAFHSLTTLNNDHISLVVYHQGEKNAFALLDALFGEKNTMLTILDGLQQQNQDIFQTTGMLYWGLKIILQIIDCCKQGITNSKAIASTIKAPPFAVAKQMKHKDTYIQNEEKLITLYQGIIELDSSIKMGKLPVEGFRVSLKKLLYTL